MKIIRLLFSVLLAIMISVFSGLWLPYTAKAESKLPPSIPKVPDITLENFKDTPPSVPSFNAFGFTDIAWRTFVTLNWPANYDGSPLPNVAFGNAPNAPRVWEFYKDPAQVFLPKGKNYLLNIPNSYPRILQLDLTKGQGSGSPGNFNSPENLQKSRAWIEKVINCGYNRAQMSASLREGEKELILNEIPVVDRQGNYILVEIRLNQNEFKQIIDNEWYNAAKLAHYNEKNGFQFKSTSTTIDAPIEVKAAWRVFHENSSPEEKRRYYTTKRILAIPATQYVYTSEPAFCPIGDYVFQEVEVGLIGFHIAYKIPLQQGSPGWIWATFEQVDNLEVDNPPPGFDLKPTLFNPDCRVNCLPNYPYVEWPFLWRDRSPHAVTFTKDGQIKEQIPTQVVRLFKDGKLANSQLTAAVKKSLEKQNKKWQEELQKAAGDSVWQYYQLVGTQWLRNPSIVNQTVPSSREWLLSKIRNDEITPGPLFNVSMEAYSQNQTHGDSCIACHVTATLPSSRGKSEKAFSDFSFLLERAKSSSDR